MEKELLTIKGNRRVSFTDALFLYVEWQGSANPREDETLADILDDLDTEYFPNDKKGSISQSLPFLTFKQAELLFRAIRQNYSTFTFKGISLAMQPMEQIGVESHPTTGIPNIDGQPQVVPFTITQDYKELVTPIIEETHRDQRFIKSTYEGISNFFSGRVGLITVYAESLGLTLAEMPTYPRPGTIQGELPGRLMSKNDQHKASIKNARKRKERTGKVYEDDEVAPPSKVPLILAIASLALSFVIFLMLLLSSGSNSRMKAEFSRVSNQVATVTKTQDNEHAIDVVSRYFLSYYYSGDKDRLKVFLDSNDAKFTNPEAATVSSTLLEKIELTDADKNIYTVTYIVATTDETQKSTIRRVTFSLKQKKSSEYGWVVTSEPSATAFVSPSANNSSEEQKEG